MPSNKRHHYVPRFYLKHFSADGNSINLYNFSAQRTILGASYKTQCYRDYYYGKDQVLEQALAAIEGASSAVLNEVVTTRRLPSNNSDRKALSVYLMAQYGRTPARAETLRQMDRGLQDEIARLASDKGFEAPCFDPLDAVALSVSLTAGEYTLLADLEARLLIAPPGQEFITSDTPVVIFNQLFDYRPAKDAASPGWLGAQLYFPVAPDLGLMLVDSGVYNMLPRNGNGEYQIESQRDMDQLNGLQIVSATENIYWRGDGLDIDRLTRIFAGRRAGPERVQVQSFSAQTGDSRALIAMQISGSAAPRSLSFVSTKSTAKRWRAAFQRQRQQPAVVVRPTAQDSRAAGE